MRIASFNMRQGGSDRHWSSILSTTVPDLLFVQETKNPRVLASEFLHPSDAKGLAWQAIAHGRWGSAILARKSTIRPVAVPGFLGWVVGGEIQLASGILFAYSIHLPPTKGSYIKSATRLLDELSPIAAGAPVILGGDWNLTVGLRRSGEERNNRPGESDLLARLENEFGLRSAWDVANPDLPLPQTLRWMRNPTTPYHCDGIFLPQWRHVEKATVLTGETWADLSDHNPVAVDWSPPL